MLREDLKKLSPDALAARVAEMELEIAELQEGKASADTLVKSYEQREQATAEESRQAQNAAWVTSVAEGDAPVMLPAERELATYVLDALTAPEGTTVKAYSETAKNAAGEETTVEVPVAEAFKRLYALRSKDTIKKLFAEDSAGTATEKSGEPAALDTADPEQEALKRAKVYAKEHGKGMADAFRAVLDSDPELKRKVGEKRMHPDGAAKAAEGSARMSRIIAPQ